MHKKVRFFGVIFSLLVLTASAFADNWWNKAWKYRRRIVFNRVSQKYPDSPGGRIKTLLPGRAFKDAHDVRITDANGKLLKYKIIWADKSDQVEIICELKNKDFVYIYWGNPQAEKLPASSEYNPKFGLILETREKPLGSYNTWAQVQQLFKKSKKIYGRTVHPYVFDGFNRFGPSENYLSHYYGWLKCPEDGTYTFYTASDDASFLFIDDKLVVQWPGMHSAYGGVYGQHHGFIELKKGWHKFDYYHVEGTGTQATVAGWRLPSKRNAQKKYEGISVILPGNFYGFREGWNDRMEILGTKFVADFYPIRTTDLYISDLDSIVKLHFRAKARGPRKVIDWCKYKWNFGDGNTAKGNYVTHIFLCAGIYKVTLTLVYDEKTIAKLSQIIRVTPIWSQSSVFSDKIAEFFFDQIENYKLNKISLRGLKNYYAVAKRIGREKALLNVLRKLVKMPNALTDYEKPTKFLELARLEAYLGKNEKNCAEALNNANKYAKSKVMKFDVQLAKAELTFKAFGHNNQALKFLTELEKQVQNYAILQRKQFYVLFGDLYRLTGKLDAARKYYETAMKTAYSSVEIDETLIADWRMRINSYILRKKAEDAYTLVKRWRNTYPVSYLDSDLAYIEVKTLLALERPAQARAQAKILIKGQPTNVYVGDVLIELGNYFYKHKKYVEAKAYFTLLFQQHREHPKATEAEKLLKQIAKKKK